MNSFQKQLKSNGNFLIMVTTLQYFYQADVYKEAKYDSTGNWLSTKTVLYDTQLPESINKVITSKHPDGIITEVNQIESGKNFFYHIYVENDEDFWYFKLDKTGEVLKSEKILDDY